LSLIDRRPLLEPVRLEPDSVASFPDTPLTFAADLTWIHQSHITARADLRAIEDVQVFVAATIATKNIKNRGSILRTESTVA
jgi:hypothetical protein